MMVDRHTLEGLDACRPHSDDLAAPELADVAAQLAGDESAGDVSTGDGQLVRLHRNLQEFDVQVSAAMHSAPVPAGLADRLLARLAEENVSPRVDASPASEPVVTEVHAQPVQVAPKVPASMSRRTLLAVGSAAALAAAVLIAAALGLLSPQSEPLTAANLDSTAREWYENLGEKWQSKAPPKAYPVSTRMLPHKRGWQSFSCPADSHAVAYDLTPQGAAHRVTLLVVRSDEPKLPGSPPSRPPVATAGHLVATWREGDLVYVLVIEGSEQLEGLYRRYVDLKSGTIA